MRGMTQPMRRHSHGKNFVRREDKPEIARFVGVDPVEKKVFG